MPSSSLPIVAHRVAIFIVPFRPAGWEASNLIAARTDIPGLAYELEAGKDGILTNSIKEAATLIKSLRFAPEYGAEVETKAVNIHHLCPIAQESVIICRTRGCEVFTVLPVPVSLM